MAEQDSKGVSEYTSSVPRYTFSDALPEQEAQLKENPSVSIGVAAFPTDAGDREKLLKKVDDALYRSKKEGRNRVSRA